VLSGSPVLNASRYQLLIGPEANQVNHVAWEGSAPPAAPLAKLPYARTWWTVKALDAQGTASWAEPRSVLRDADEDSLSDEVELRGYHTDPDDPDTDDDGHVDGQEAFAGTNPLQPNTGPQLRFQLQTGNQLQFTWYTDAGEAYDLESSPTFDPPAWKVIQSFPASENKMLEYTVPQLTGPSAYYRLRSYTQTLR